MNNNKSFFIRFGLHKDRDVLEKSKVLYEGMVLPAHILSYSQDATIAAVNYIDHDYFIDPMTYVLTSQTIKNYITEKKDDDNNSYISFKPSIKKMVENYGVYSHFESNSFKALQPEEATSLMDTFTSDNIKLQLSHIDNGFAPAFKKYSQLLKLEKKERSPLFVTPPYFYFDNAGQSAWRAINLAYAQMTKDKVNSGSSGLSTVPIVATNTANLDASLITEYKDFGKIILWLSDLDESRCNFPQKQPGRLKKYRAFISEAKKSGLAVSNLYGSYFSLMCRFDGLESIANGIFYGEFKDYKQKVGGGGPSSRFYISAFHKFFPIPQTISIFESYPELLQLEPESTRKLLGANPLNELARFAKEMDLAQMHFLEARQQELDKIKSTSREDLIKNLRDTYKQYSPLPSRIADENVLDHLQYWADALQDEDSEEE